MTNDENWPTSPHPLARAIGAHVNPRRCDYRQTRRHLCHKRALRDSARGTTVQEKYRRGHTLTRRAEPSSGDQFRAPTTTASSLRNHRRAGQAGPTGDARTPSRPPGRPERAPKTTARVDDKR